MLKIKNNKNTQILDQLQEVLSKKEKTFQKNFQV